jgi:SNF2 family DNA or RNA helicase
MKHPPSTPDLDARKREESLWKESLKAWHHEMEMADVPKKLLTTSSKKEGKAPFGSRAGTLVVCPLIALLQWKEEIEKFTEEKALTICCYHGPNRASQCPRELLCKYDIVLTTYQIIEADFRKMVSPNKVKCPNCGGSFKVGFFGIDRSSVLRIVLLD